jgi:GAF domain
VVEIADGEEMVYRVASGTAAQYVGLRLGIDASLSGLCVREGRTLHCVESETDPRVSAAACRRVGATSMLCVPLRHYGEAAGVLKVYDARAHAFSEDDVETLDLLSGVIAAHVAHATEFQARAGTRAATTRSPACRTGARSMNASGRSWRPRGATAANWPSACWISTTSSRSTTPAATPPATPCCRPSRATSAPSAARTRRTASAVTSSP